MIRHLLAFTALAALTMTACESAPTSPTIIEAPHVAPVATAVPNLWDSRDELAAWVSNGVTKGDAVIVGDGSDAVIRVDLNGGPALLHGPDLDPPLSDVQSARLRYRWVPRDPNDAPYLLMYLSPPKALKVNGIPYVFPPIGRDLSEIKSGAWLEQVWTAFGRTNPPYQVVSTMINVSTLSPTTTNHGALEIDWIELVRQ